MLELSSKPPLGSRVFTRVRSINQLARVSKSWLPIRFPWERLTKHRFWSPVQIPTESNSGWWGPGICIVKGWVLLSWSKCADERGCREVSSELDPQGTVEKKAQFLPLRDF